MMYANLRGPDGTILGSVQVDPTAPGGLQGALNNAVQRLQTQSSHLPNAQRPLQPGFMPPGPSGPTSQSRPFVCQLRFMARQANGQMQWMTRAINCPAGLPPGLYTHTPY